MVAVGLSICETCVFHSIQSSHRPEAAQLTVLQCSTADPGTEPAPAVADCRRGVWLAAVSLVHPSAWPMPLPPFHDQAGRHFGGMRGAAPIEVRFPPATGRARKPGRPRRRWFIPRQEFMGKHADSVDQHVLRRIVAKGEGWVFTPSDFQDLGSRTAVDLALGRLPHRWPFSPRQIGSFRHCGGWGVATWTTRPARCSPNG